PPALPFCAPFIPRDTVSIAFPMVSETVWFSLLKSLLSTAFWIVLRISSPNLSQSLFIMNCLLKKLDLSIILYNNHFIRFLYKSQESNRNNEAGHQDTNYI